MDDAANAINWFDLSIHYSWLRELGKMLHL
jgi:hypothetical protein